MNTAKITIAPSDLPKLLPEDREYTELFIIQGVDQYGNVTLEHDIDGNPSTLEIVLHPSGQWSATKHIEI